MQHARCWRRRLRSVRGLRPGYLSNLAACAFIGMLAGNGRCKTLDAGADGYVRSEGLGLVAMRSVTSLDPTGSDIGGSDILITGSAVNQDGRSSGLTAPNGPSQQNLIRLALSLAHLPPHMVRLSYTCVRLQLAQYMP